MQAGSRPAWPERRVADLSKGSCQPAPSSAQPASQAVTEHSQIPSSDLAPATQGGEAVAAPGLSLPIERGQQTCAGRAVVRTDKVGFGA